MKFKLSFLSIVFICLLVACSGGSSSDDDIAPSSGSGSSSSGGTPGVIDATAREVALAANDTSAQILSSESGVDMVRSNSGSFPYAEILKDALAAAKATGSVPKDIVSEPETILEEGACGGSMNGTCVRTYDDDPDVFFPVEVDCDYTLEGYCLNVDMNDDVYEVVYDGQYSAYMMCTDVSNCSSEYRYDFTYTSTIPPYNLSGSVHYAESCYLLDGTQECSVGIYESGTTTYHTSDVSVSGSASSGYDVSYTINDSDGHVFYVEFTDLTLCDNGKIGSGGGSIRFDADELISVEFISCEEAVVTYDGITETVSQ